VENLLSDVDRQISAIQAELRVLAVSPSLRADDFLAFDRQMREALKIQGTSIVLLDTKAQQLINTNRPFGEPLPRAINSEMLDRVVETGKPQISDLIIGAVLRRPVLTVGAPVFRNGKVAYVLVMVGLHSDRPPGAETGCTPPGPQQRGGVTTYGSARWATEPEMRAAGLLEPAGIHLGRLGKQHLRHAGPEHVLCFAPTRSGKGVGLVVPTLLRAVSVLRLVVPLRRLCPELSWASSAVVHDIKGENCRIL
jgi:hypothetical protein